MARNKSSFFGFFILLIAFSLFIPKDAFAGFRLLDAIEEFGEKRYVRPTPSRLKAGPVVFHPSLRTKIEYDSNLLLEDEDAKDDVLFDINPGMVIEIPVDSHQIAVGYEADFEVFAKRDSQNDQNQEFFTLVDLNFPNWYVNVLEEFSETSSRSGTTFTGRIPRYDNSIHPKVGYKWNRMTFEQGFRHHIRDFRRDVDDRFDFQMVEWTSVVYFDIFARLKALFEYQFAQPDYDDDFSRDANINQVRIGLVGDVMPNMTVKVNTGIQLRNYEESNENDFNGWIYDVLTEYRMRENLRFKVGSAREIHDATFARVNHYVQYNYYLGAQYDLTPKWNLHTELKYFRNSYQETATIGGITKFRKDDHIGLKTGVRYLMNEWMELDLSYEYRRRDSNFASLDYTDNRLSLTSIMRY